MNETVAALAELPSRFTLDGSDQLERHLARTCQNVLAGIRHLVPDNLLEALLLGGGYGRGEGGVLETPTGHWPYNDLEFYVFIHGNRWLNERRYLGPLHQLGHKLGQRAGLEVEFKIISQAQLRSSSPSMFYYDLMTGHQWLWGDQRRLADCAHHRSAPHIPLSEATRLLMNRGTGLLFAREVLSRRPFTSENADFVGRNLAKAQLALGDAVLTAFGQFHWSCRQRHERLRTLDPKEPLAWLPDVLRHHEHGVEFKLHPLPSSASPETLQRQYDDLSALGLNVWLWLESRRLGHRFVSARDYGLSSLNKCPETNRWRNLLVNAKAFGPAALWKTKAWRYPRERLLNSLAILLWEGSVFDVKLTRRLQGELLVETTDRNSFVQAYQTLSARLNGSALLPL